MAGPIGTAIGTGVGAIGGALFGWIGGKKREEEARRRMIAANEKATRYNAFNRSSAYTDYL
jgi:surface antigen